MRLAVVMDPIQSIKVAKDSTFAMLLAAQARGWELHYLELGDLALLDGEALGRNRQLEVYDHPQQWFRFTGEAQCTPLGEFDLILMRKDPPFDMEYVHSTYLLEQAQQAGALIVNDPRSLRDANEKLFTAWFPHCCPPTLVTRDGAQIRSFLAEQGEVILKPLGGMGGTSIFRLSKDDPNVSVALETLTQHGRCFTMAQRYLPEISAGDKRILLINGEPVSYALARIPAPGETRGNLAAGGHGEGVALSERDLWICAQVGPELKRRGLLFVGLDVIGDYLTEINVTSPTCIRELDTLYNLDIAGQLIDSLQELVKAQPRTK